MSCIVLVGGIIGCGKTTYINYFQESEKTNYLYSFFNNEENKKKVKTKKSSRIILDELCSIEDQANMMNTLKGWRHFRVDLLMAAEHFVNSLCGSTLIEFGPLTERSSLLLEKLNEKNKSVTFESDVIFFVEDNFYYRSMRYDWFQLARRANIGFCELFLKCHTDLAISRNSQRGYNIPEDKIKRMVTFMEYPEPEKYKWEKYSIVLDSANKLEISLFKEVIDCIEKAANNPAEMLIMAEKIEAQRICSKNIVHQADNIIRKLISKIVSNIKECNEATDFKRLTTDLAEIRQNLLHSIRHGSVNLPQNLSENLKNEGIKSVKSEFEEVITDLFEEIWHKKLSDDKVINENDIMLEHVKFISAIKNVN